MTGPTAAAQPPWSWAIGAALAVTPVSRTWRVRVGERQAVLRVDEPGARRLGLNRMAEPAVLRAVAAADLGPGCLRADPAGGVLLTEWLPGQACTADGLRQPATLRQAAALLRRVHDLPVSGPALDLRAAIDRYAGAAGPAGATLAGTAREHLERVMGSRESLGLAKACLCHGDPTPGNFIAGPDGGLKLIDWEYAGVGPPGFDLGGLAAGSGLTADQSGLMLEAYLGRAPTRAEMDGIEAWAGLCQILGSLWAAAR
jgi:thiamine kinase